MNTGKLNIIAILAALLATAGCSTQQAYSNGTPIMSAADAKAMIQVDVRAIEPKPEEQVLVAATAGSDYSAIPSR